MESVLKKKSETGLSSCFRPTYFEGTSNQKSEPQKLFGFILLQVDFI